MATAGSERAPGTGELAAIVHGEPHEPVDLGAEQLQQLRGQKPSEATANHLAELLAARPDLYEQESSAPKYGLGVRTTGQPDAQAAVYSADGTIEYYDF